MRKDDCIFCQIIEKKAPATIEYQDELITVIHDINPKAPLHLLILPNDHLTSLLDIDEEQHSHLLAHMMHTAKSIAQQRGIATEERGYRLIVNTGKEGGQVVWHLHMHLLGGKQLAV